MKLPKKPYNPAQYLRALPAGVSVSGDDKEDAETISLDAARLNETTSGEDHVPTPQASLHDGLEMNNKLRLLESVRCCDEDAAIADVADTYTGNSFVDKDDGTKLTGASDYPELITSSY